MYIKECILDISHHCNLPQKYTPVNPTIIVFIFIYKHIATLLNEWTMIVFFFFFFNTNGPYIILVDLGPIQVSPYL